MSYTRLSFWLIPAREYRERFQHIIDRLAQRFAAPSFMPHVTIYSGPATAGETPARMLAAATKDITPFSLTVENVRHTEAYTKTLFVRLGPVDALQTLSDRLRRLCEIPSGFVLDPHLSLLYAHIDERERRELARSVSVPYTQILFDEVRAVATGERTLTKKDVECWREVCTVALRGSQPDLCGV